MLAMMDSSMLATITRLTARERLLIASLRGAAMDESADKLAALADVVRALDRLGASHAVVGGVAVGLRSGVPRATVDTDLVVRSTIAQRSIIETLTGAGLRLTDTFAHSLNFRHSSGELVRIIFDAELDPMIDRAEPLDVAGARIRVVTTADLIAIKERAAADPARRRGKALQDQAPTSRCCEATSPTRTRAGSARSVRLRGRRRRGRCASPRATAAAPPTAR